MPIVQTEMSEINEESVVASPGDKEHIPAAISKIQSGAYNNVDDCLRLLYCGS